MTHSPEALDVLHEAWAAQREGSPEQSKARGVYDTAIAKCYNEAPIIYHAWMRSRVAQWATQTKEKAINMTTVLSDVLKRELKSGEIVALDAHGVYHRGKGKRSWRLTPWQDIFQASIAAPWEPGSGETFTLGPAATASGNIHKGALVVAVPAAPAPRPGIILSHPANPRAAAKRDNKASPAKRLADERSAREPAPSKAVDVTRSVEADASLPSGLSDTVDPTRKYQSTCPKCGAKGFFKRGAAHVTSGIACAGAK